MIRRETADDRVVRNIEVLRPRPFGEKCAADIFDVTMPDGDGAGARDPFDARKKGNIGIANREAFEVVVICGHHVEEVVSAVAIENGLAVSSRFDHDGPVRSAALRQIVSAVRGSSAACSASTVFETVVFIET